MKKTKFPITYLAILAVAAFAGWVYFSEYKGGEAKEEAAAEASTLLPFSISKVSEISIHSSGFVTVLKKSDGTWKVEKPYQDLGESTSVDGFLATLSTEKTKETVVEGPDINWKTYGLEIPVAETTIIAKVDGGEKKRRVQVGTVPAFDGSVYARIDGENKVVLMASSVQAALQKDPRDFRNKRLFPEAEHPEFKAFEFSRLGYPKLSFEKKNDVWLEASVKIGAWPLDQGVVKSFVDATVGLRGNDVWGEDNKDQKVLKARKLDLPGTTVVLTSVQDQKYELKIAELGKGEEVAGGLSSKRPLVFSIYKAQVELFSKTIDDFRELGFPFQFKIADVQAIELERTKGEVSLPILTKRDGKWIVDPVDTRFRGREAKAELVDRLLAEINAIRAKRIMPKLAPVPKLGPRGSVRVAVFAAKNQRLAEFVFNADGETAHVTSSIVPGKVFEIEHAVFDTLTLNVMTDRPEKKP